MNFDHGEIAAAVSHILRLFNEFFDACVLAMEEKFYKKLASVEVQLQRVIINYLFIYYNLHFKHSVIFF